tara:strand:- start:5434 stop:5562 length:129 start_codon:yes stop_codon:yes gene_type:complete
MKNAKIIIPVILVLIALGALAVTAMNSNDASVDMVKSHGHEH